MIDGIDKVTVTAHYDDSGRCRSIFVYLNDDFVTTEDVASAVRAVFRPEAQRPPMWNSATVSNDIVEPRVRVNGSDLYPGGL
jgi:hypothetical protein